MRVAAIVAAMFALCTFADVAAAQPDAAEQRLAREETQRGIAAARADRWDEARAAFEHAYALSKKPGALFSLAGAQAKTGRLVEAAESYRKITKLESDVTEDQRKIARDALAGLEPRLAHLRIVVRGGARTDDAVAIDGHAVSTAALALDLAANPGPHEVTLARTGARTPAVTITLAEGETRAVTLLPVAEPGAPPPPPRKTESGSILGSPWLWAGVGVLVVGATVGVVCLAGACSNDAPPPPPYRGTLGTATFP